MNDDGAWSRPTPQTPAPTDPDGGSGGATTLDDRAAASAPAPGVDSAAATVGGVTARLLADSASLAAAYLAGIADGPVWQPVDEHTRTWWAEAQLPEHPAVPETATDASATTATTGSLLADIRDRVLLYPMGNGHPAFFGWVNSAPEPHALAGAWLAAAMNPSSAGGDHADVLVERTVVRWLADLVRFPHQPGAGLLTSGASMATIVAVGAARQRALTGLGWDVRREGMAGSPVLTAYATAETHSCLTKAVELLGIGTRHLRAVPLREGRMDTRALAGLVAADRAAGLHPFLVVGSAGTVNTGTVDPLDAIADVCEDERIWFHVDGAYGGFGAVDPRLSEAFRGLARADSLALDPHKWLQVPVGVGCLLVAGREQLRETYSLVPPYLRDEGGDRLGWYSEYGIEQTRPFRALPVWATLAGRGRAGVVADVTACTDTARRLGRMVEQEPGLVLAAPVQVSIVALRWAPDGVSREQADRVTAAIPAAVNARGRAFVTGSQFDGRPIVRACLINPLAGDAHARLLVSECAAAAAELSR
ncbi:MAG TPA: pyridoxal-dependent decarboxylase [Actinocrinis sp.]|nr:pyridoxal-dependent decarboxylase [Actinocrinis sp.]